MPRARRGRIVRPRLGIFVCRAVFHVECLHLNQEDMKTRRLTSRRGMTLVEVVLASALLAMLASALAGAVVFAHRAEIQRIKRLMAHDVANRLLLQFIDDKYNKGLPAQSDPVAYEGLRFFYEIIEEPVEMRNLNGEIPKQADGMRLIRIRVYDAFEVSPGNVQRRERLAEIVRPYHLLVALYRNPNSMARNLSNQEFLTELTRMPSAATGSGGGR